MKLPSCSKVIVIDNYHLVPLFFSFSRKFAKQITCKTGIDRLYFLSFAEKFIISLCLQYFLNFFYLICFNLPFMSENEHTFLRTRFLEIDYCLFSTFGKVFVQLYLGLDLHEREKTGT